MIIVLVYTNIDIITIVIITLVISNFAIVTFVITTTNIVIRVCYITHESTSYDNWDGERSLRFFNAEITLCLVNIAFIKRGVRNVAFVILVNLGKPEARQNYSFLSKIISLEHVCGFQARNFMLNIFLTRRLIAYLIKPNRQCAVDVTQSNPVSLFRSDLAHFLLSVTYEYILSLAVI